jgi:thioredoxin 1
VIPNTGSVLIDFYADWCGPCHAVAPVLDKLSLVTGIPVVKVDIDTHRTEADLYSISSIPTIVYVVDGQEQSRVTGALPLGALTDKLGLTPSE